MYNKFFGFKEKPFKLVPNPEYLFLSKSHEETLAHLNYAISQGDGFVEITGEVGTGKTTLCRVFLESLDRGVNAAYIFNPKLDALQLLKAMNDEFGIDSKPDNTKDLIDILNTFLIEKKASGQKVLVLIDEAQNLSLEVLEQLRLLSNLETTRDKLLQIILVGQPELGDLLSSHQLRQLGQRITINCQLAPLTFQETTDYIRHRISLASHRAGPPFDKASYRAIYEYSHGVPRLINIACDRTLLNAFSRNSFKITAAITREAIRELSKKKASPSYNRVPGFPGFAIVSAIVIPLVALLLYFANEQSPRPPDSSKPSSPDRVSQQIEAGQVTEEDEQVPEISTPPEKTHQLIERKPAAGSKPRELSPDKAEAPVEALLVHGNENSEDTTGDIVLHSVHIGTFLSESEAGGRVEEMKALGFPSFMYIQENSAGNPVFIAVAGRYQSYDLAKEASRRLSREGYSNFIARAKDSLVAEAGKSEHQDLTGTVVQQSQATGDRQDFFNYLKGLNSRYSRNYSMENILKQWFPNEEVQIKQSKIITDRTFFKEAAKPYDLHVLPIATKSDIAPIQTLNLPAIFTFYLVGHSWPKYLAVTYLDQEKIYFAAGEEGRTVAVDKDVFLQYWSGEAYIIWKNFNKLNGMITPQSKGNKVRSLKKLLQHLGYENLASTDEYDEDTLQIIKNIQARYGLHVDGLVGPLTKIALYNENNSLAKPSLTQSVIVTSESAL